MCDMVDIRLVILVSSTVNTSHFDANASQIMKIINITAVSGMNELIDEIVFHVVYASRYIIVVFQVDLGNVVGRRLYLHLQQI